MPIKAKARARGLMGVACIVALRAAGPQRSAIPGGCTQNTLKSSLGAASCEHGNRYDGEGLSFFKNSSGRNSNIWIYNCLNLIDLSLKNVLLMARSWWTGRKRRRPEDEGAPVVHVFQGEGRRRLKRTEDRHRWLYFSCPAHHPFCN